MYRNPHHSLLADPSRIGVALDERFMCIAQDAQDELFVNLGSHRTNLRRKRRFAPGSLVTNASPRGTTGGRANPFTEPVYIDSAYV